MYSVQGRYTLMLKSNNTIIILIRFNKLERKINFYIVNNNINNSIIDGRWSAVYNLGHLGIYSITVCLYLHQNRIMVFRIVNIFIMNDLEMSSSTSLKKKKKILFRLFISLLLYQVSIIKNKCNILVVLIINSFINIT